jgi:DNA polymerase II small subunit/DNA polymerase delta subunit B
MARTYDRQTDDESDEQTTPDIYLPAMASLSTDAGRVEQFVANLFRRRGGLRAIIRSKSR